MPACENLIRNVQVVERQRARTLFGRCPASTMGMICAIGDLSSYHANTTTDGKGRVLSPGFIDVHTHDDTSVISSPQMLPKLSQGVTTVIVGNCGISAAPVQLRGAPPDPMNLLGAADAFCYPPLPLTWQR